MARLPGAAPTRSETGGGSHRSKSAKLSTSGKTLMPQHHGRRRNWWTQGTFRYRWWITQSFKDRQLRFRHLRWQVRLWLPVSSRFTSSGGVTSLPATDSPSGAGGTHARPSGMTGNSTEWLWWFWIQVSCRLNEKCRESKDVLQRIKRLTGWEKKKKKTRNKRWQKGNTKTSEHLQDSVLLWNDSTLPNKLTLTQTKPTQHATPSCAEGRLVWTWNSTFPEPRSAQGVSKKIKLLVQQGQTLPRTFQSQEEVNTEQLYYAFPSSPLVYFQWEVASGAADPPSCKPSASRTPSVKGICCCPSAAKISSYPLILICPEKFTSKATAALQRGNKLQWSGESGPPQPWPELLQVFRGALAQITKISNPNLRKGWGGRLFVNLLKEGQPLRFLWKSPFVISNPFWHRLKISCYLLPLRSLKKY